MVFLTIWEKILSIFAKFNYDSYYLITLLYRYEDIIN